MRTELIVDPKLVILDGTGKVITYNSILKNNDKIEGIIDNLCSCEIKKEQTVLQIADLFKVYGVEFKVGEKERMDTGGTSLSLQSLLPIETIKIDKGDSLLVVAIKK